MEIISMIAYAILEYKDGIKKRIRTMYLNKESAYRKIDLLNEKQNVYEYKIKEIEINEK